MEILVRRKRAEGAEKGKRVTERGRGRVGRNIQGEEEKVRGR